MFDQWCITLTYRKPTIKKTIDRNIVTPNPLIRDNIFQRRKTIKTIHYVTMLEDNWFTTVFKKTTS